VSLLSAAISKQPKGLVHLNLSQTGITGRGVNKLTEALCSNQLICDTLDVLDLSQNSLKGEEVTVSQSFDDVGGDVQCMHTHMIVKYGVFAVLLCYVYWKASVVVELHCLSEPV